MNWKTIAVIVGVGVVITALLKKKAAPGMVYSVYRPVQPQQVTNSLYTPLLDTGNTAPASATTTESNAVEESPANATAGTETEPLQPNGQPVLAIAF
jgi:hypothetical protein